MTQNLRLPGTTGHRPAASAIKAQPKSSLRQSPTNLWGKDDPIPYWFEKALIVLLLSVFAFIFGHVILEAISEIRDKVLKKGKEEHHE